MRRMVWAAALLMIGYLPAHAAKSEFGFALGGGMSGTIGDLATHADYGFHGFGGIRFTPTPTGQGDIDLLLVGGLHKFSAKLSDRRDIGFVTVGLEGRLNNMLHSTANIYLVSGAGMARTKLAAYEDIVRLGSSIQQVRPVSERTESNVYITAGLGIQTGREGALQFFVEGKVTNVFGTELKNLTWFPVSVGLLF